MWVEMQGESGGHIRPDQAWCFWPRRGNPFCNPPIPPLQWLAWDSWLFRWERVKSLSWDVGPGTPSQKTHVSLPFFRCLDAGLSWFYHCFIMVFLHKSQEKCGCSMVLSWFYHGFIMVLSILWSNKTWQDWQPFSVSTRPPWVWPWVTPPRNEPSMQCWALRWCWSCCSISSMASIWASAFDAPRMWQPCWDLKKTFMMGKNIMKIPDVPRCFDDNFWICNPNWQRVWSLSKKQLRWSHFRSTWDIEFFVFFGLLVECCFLDTTFQLTGARQLTSLLTSEEKKLRNPALYIDDLGKIHEYIDLYKYTSIYIYIVLIVWIYIYMYNSTYSMNIVLIYIYTYYYTII